MNLEWLAEQVAAGKTDAVIAAEAGVPAHMVGYYRRTHLNKIRTPGNRRKWDITREWLVEQVAANRSDVDIAAEKGMTVSAVGQYRRRWKIPPRPSWIRAQESHRAKYPNGRVGPLAGNWRGGRRSSTGSKPGGYIRLYMPDHPDATKGYVYEHRHVMEQMIGRRLKTTEIVDHIDRNRSNNAPENLRLHETRAQHVKDHFSARDQLTIVMAELARYKERYGPLDEG